MILQPRKAKQIDSETLSNLEAFFNPPPRSIVMKNRERYDEDYDEYCSECYNEGLMEILENIRDQKITVEKGLNSIHLLRFKNY